MFTITVSFKPTGSNTEAIAELIRLLAELENSGTTELNPEPGENSVETVVKSTKPRKVRVYTDEQKAAFRARMVAAREAKANATGSKPVEPNPVKAEGSKKPSQSNQVAKLSTKVSTMPRTGRKMVAKAAAQ
jgi:hypothetical protein